MPLPTIPSGNVASALGGAYEVANSCRFNDGDSPTIQRTPSSSGSNTVFTMSMWIKRSNLGAAQCLWNNGGSPQGQITILAGDDLVVYDGATTVINTNRKFRDVSAWYHIVLACNASESGNDKVKLYVNGVLETSFATDNRSSFSNLNNVNQSGQEMSISSNGAGSQYFDGYMAEIVLIDGSQLAATSFGEFDEDSPTIWKPIDVSGLTKGTNGFYLDFEDSSNLGNCAFGGTDLTESNLAAADQTTDTPTNNFCTFNPLAPSAAALAAHANGFGEGNLQNGEQSPNNWQSLPSTFGVTSGKWYWEFKDENSWGSTSNSTRRYGICDLDTILHTESSSTDVKFSDTTSAYAYMNASGVRYNNGTISGTTSDHPTFTDDDIIMVALDLTNNKLYFGKNGTWNDSGDPTSGSTGTGSVADISATATWSPYVETQYGSDNVSANFGNPIAAPSSGNADGNGYGNFEYAPPSGYLALCTKNLGSDGG